MWANTLLVGNVIVGGATWEAIGGQREDRRQDNTIQLFSALSELIINSIL